MKLFILKELRIIIIVLLPFIYLAYVWSSLSDQVPIHWNSQGDIDRIGDKSELILIPILLPLLIYVIFLIIPKIDPKNKIKNMGNSYQSIKNLVTTFVSILALFIIYSSKNQSYENLNYVVFLIAIFYIILGSYFKSLKTNYFIGIRTPWTLKSEIIWKKTHEVSGEFWIIGGVIIVFFSMLLNRQPTLILFLIVTGIITIIPVAYSYLLFKNRNHS